MTVQEAVQQLQYAPITERIQAIEILLQSLKNELLQRESVQAEHKPFHVRTFDLGADIQIDRDTANLSFYR